MFVVFTANLIMTTKKGATYAAGNAVIVRCCFYCDLLLASLGMTELHPKDEITK